MIHHLPEDVRRKGFQEIRRVLRPGGRFLVFDLSGKGSLVWRILSMVGHRLPSDYAQQLSEMVGAAGFAPQIIPSQKQYVTVVGHKPV
jgi:SAM-dependent methyltransferase